MDFPSFQCLSKRHPPRNFAVSTSLRKHCADKVFSPLKHRGIPLGTPWLKRRKERLYVPLEKRVKIARAVVVYAAFIRSR
jgi:hypothetical protein